MKQDKNADYTNKGKGQLELCRVQIGFIHTKICNQPAVAHCDRCHKPVCENHKKEIGVNTFCPECAAEVLSKEPEYRNKLKKLPPEAWYYNTREHLYSKLGFRPFYNYSFKHPNISTFKYHKKNIDYFDS